MPQILWRNQVGEARSVRCRRCSQGGWAGSRPHEMEREAPCELTPQSNRGTNVRRSLDEREKQENWHVGVRLTVAHRSEIPCRYVCPPVHREVRLRSHGDEREWTISRLARRTVHRLDGQRCAPWLRNQLQEEQVRRDHPSQLGERKKERYGSQASEEQSCILR